MATVRTANAHWEGSLLEGSGTVELASSGLATFDVSWPARAEAANGKTSPEELIAAAHSTCFSMALSHGLAGAGTPPTTVDTTADVTFQPGVGRAGCIQLIERPLMQNGGRFYALHCTHEWRVCRADTVDDIRQIFPVGRHVIGGDRIGHFRHWLNPRT